MFIDLKKRKKRVNKRIHTPHKMYSQTKRQQQIALFFSKSTTKYIRKFTHTTHSNCKNLIVFLISDNFIISIVQACKKKTENHRKSNKIEKKKLERIQSQLQQY